MRAISRPGIYQRVFYNGHKSYHTLKFQSVLVPNGLIANLYGPVEGKRHDSGMLMDPGLLNQLQQYSFGHGDPAYPLRVHLQAAFKGARLLQQQIDWNT